MIDDDIGTTRWFGESWGAPVNDPRTHVETPTNERCLECLLWIRAGDQGFQIPGGETPGHVTFHKQCFFDAIGVSS